jgi:motility quorum-sensing regulator/GCU-specific mRNA interferase toxin
MEKRTPHCRLTDIKRLISQRKVRATMSALAGGAALGMEFSEMLGVIATLKAVDFHKSMTTHDDHRVWQDVYRPMTRLGPVYLKLTVIDDVLIVSFKAR